VWMAQRFRSWERCTPRRRPTLESGELDLVVRDFDGASQGGDLLHIMAAAPGFETFG